MTRLPRAAAVAVSAALAWSAPTRAADPVVVPGLPAPLVPHAVSTNTTTNINTIVNASSVYSSFTGTRAVAANIELGIGWNGFEALNHLQTFITNPGGAGSGPMPPMTALDGHATAVMHALGGRTTSTNPNERQRGIAPGATLWSGGILPSPTGDGYLTNVQPYRTAMLSGIAGVTADVVNSSYGYAELGGSTSFDPAGVTNAPRAIDALTRASAKAVVFSAGDGGSAQLGGYQAMYNTINVGSLANDTIANKYSLVSSFSSRGASDTFIPIDQSGTTGFQFSGTRFRVDIAAPGQNLQLATQFPTGSPGAANAYSNAAGTSFAAPIVAGGLALMADAAKANGRMTGLDGRVLKAVLLTSADKTPGWNNGQTTTAGVIRTTQALDQAVGAGRMNVGAAIPFFTTGGAFTRDVAGTTSGNLGPVQTSGWDLGRVTTIASNDYALDSDLLVGSKLTVTLTWFVNRGINTTTLDASTLTENGMADLDVQIWKLAADGSFQTLVASSETQFNTTEHLSITLNSFGRYGLRVNYFGDNWNFVGTTSEQYGLAWLYTPVPEPTGLLAALLVAGVAVRFGQRRAMSNSLQCPTNDQEQKG